MVGEDQARDATRAPGAAVAAGSRCPGCASLAGSDGCSHLMAAEPYDSVVWLNGRDSNL